MIFFIIYLVNVIISISACVIIGREKNRNGFLWGFFLGIFGILIIALLPELEDSNTGTIRNASNLRQIKETEKKCKTCGSIIDVESKRCPVCGSDNFLLSTFQIDDSLPKIKKEEEYEIICPSCMKKMVITNIGKKFETIKCIKCGKKITSKNVIYN